MGALRFILRRLAFSVALILGVSFILFALINAIGNPIQILLAETPGVSEEMIAALSKFYGVDGNFIDRYLSWLWAIVRFDFG
ncbi:MAG: peptide/nickel transport system permease protein, partial [Rhodospirillaceae bacterium]|nr:peptide/nickel transport system permease protein [Rhodospirillaceae bacterium]